MRTPDAKYLLWQWDGSFKSAVVAPGIASDSSTLTFAVSDVNKDGLADILLGVAGAIPTIQIYINGGGETFSLFRSYPVTLSGQTSQRILQILPVDLNGDGWPDWQVIFPMSSISTRQGP